MTERIVTGGFVSTLSATLKRLINSHAPGYNRGSGDKFARIPAMDSLALLKAGFQSI